MGKRNWMMGWNSGYAIMEETVISLYDKEILTNDLLDTTMGPYKNTDCDSVGSLGLKSKDDLGVEEIICKVMKPDDYKKVIESPEWYKGEEPGTEYHNRWHSNEKANELFDSIWHDMWGIY